MVSANKGCTIVEELTVLCTREVGPGPRLQGHAVGWVCYSGEASSLSKDLIPK